MKIVGSLVRPLPDSHVSPLSPDGRGRPGYPALDREEIMRIGQDAKIYNILHLQSSDFRGAISILWGLGGR